MKVKAELNYLRIAPRKMRLIVENLRNKKIQEAKTVLNFTVKKGSLPLLKLLNSAVANAQNNFQLDPEKLYISKITVDEGPKFKRWMPRARGSAYEIQKKTSHVTVVLEGQEKKEFQKTVEKEEKTVAQKQKFSKELKSQKPKTGTGIRRYFQRKAV